MKKEKAKEIPVDFITGKFKSVDLYIPDMDKLKEVTDELNRARKNVAEAENKAIKEKAEKELKRVKAEYIDLQLKINSAWYKVYIEPIEKQFGTKNFMQILRERLPIPKYQSPPNAPPPKYKPYEEDPSQWERHYFFNKNESEISDKEFFKMIRDNPVFLGFPFAQQKIRRWREEMRDKDKSKADNARIKLKDIGISLAFKGWDKSRTYKTMVASCYCETLKKLKDSGISKLRSEANRNLRRKELFGAEIIDSINKDATQPINLYTNRELAVLITAKYFPLLLPETVKKYLKRVTTANYGSGLQAFQLKKPRR